MAKREALGVSEAASGLCEVALLGLLLGCQVWWRSSGSCVVGEVHGCALSCCLLVRLCVVCGVCGSNKL